VLRFSFAEILSHGEFGERKDTSTPSTFGSAVFFVDGGDKKPSACMAEGSGV
jgi:hypothetical protein